MTQPLSPIPESDLALITGGVAGDDDYAPGESTMHCRSVGADIVCVYTDNGPDAPQ